MITFDIKGINNIIDKKYKKYINKKEDEKNDMYNNIIKSKEFKNNDYEKKFTNLYNYINLDKNNAFNILKKNKTDLLCIYKCAKDDKDYLKLLNFTRLKKLGNGFFGNVYSGIKNKKKYALKVQEFDSKDNRSWYNKTIDQFIKNRLNEYKIGKKLGDHGISPKVYNKYFIYDTMNDKIINIIEMEYVKGQTLSSYENKKKLTDKEKELINKKIKKLHKLKIYHQDLHKENILVIKKNKKIDFYLIDFGLSHYEKDILKNMKNRNDPWHWNTKNNKKYNIMKLLITNDILTNNLINIII